MFLIQYQYFLINSNGAPFNVCITFKLYMDFSEFFDE